MPRRLYKLNDFSGGLNTVKDVADINDNEVSVGRNLMFNVYGGMQPAYTMTDSTNNKIRKTKVLPNYCMMNSFSWTQISHVSKNRFEKNIFFVFFNKNIIS